MKNITFERITWDNLDLACKIQNELFPEEDARYNFIEQINRDPYRLEMDYEIVYVDGEPMGLTGIYVYPEYPEDAWLGWFGIIDKYRHQGYGGAILDKTIKIAKEKGYKNFRLYTDEYATDAHKLYESRGLIKEAYDRPDDQDEYLDWKIFVYSKSLTDKKVEMWNNKLLGLKEQGEKENYFN